MRLTANDGKVIALEHTFRASRGAAIGACICCVEQRELVLATTDHTEECGWHGMLGLLASYIGGQFVLR